MFSRDAAEGRVAVWATLWSTRCVGEFTTLFSCFHNLTVGNWFLCGFFVYFQLKKNPLDSVFLKCYCAQNKYEVEQKKNGVHVWRKCVWLKWTGILYLKESWMGMLYGNTKLNPLLQNLLHLHCPNFGSSFRQMSHSQLFSLPINHKSPSQIQNIYSQFVSANMPMYWHTNTTVTLLTRHSQLASTKKLVFTGL